MSPSCSEHIIDLFTNWVTVGTRRQNLVMIIAVLWLVKSTRVAISIFTLQRLGYGFMGDESEKNYDQTCCYNLLKQKKWRGWLILTLPILDIKLTVLWQLS